MSLTKKEMMILLSSSSSKNKETESAMKKIKKDLMKYNLK